MEISQKCILSVKSREHNSVYTTISVKKSKNIFVFVDVHKIPEEKLLTKVVVYGEEKWVAVGNGWERNITICPFIPFGLYKCTVYSKNYMLKRFSFSDIYSILMPLQKYCMQI